MDRNSLFIRKRKTKYSGNTVEINRASQPAAGRLGELVNPATISTYFTEPAAAGRQRGVYFYLISIVFLLGTLYLVLRTIIPNH